MPVTIDKSNWLQLEFVEVLEGSEGNLWKLNRVKIKPKRTRKKMAQAHIDCGFKQLDLFEDNPS